MSQLDQPLETVGPLGGPSLLIASAIALGRLVSKPRTILHVLSYFRRRLTGRTKAVGKNLPLYVIDLSMALAALSFASFMRLGLDGEVSNPESFQSLLFALPCFFLTCAVVFPVTCLYTRNWRYASVGDMFGIVRAVLVASLAFVFVMFVATRLELIPRSVIVIEALLLVPMLISVRIRSKLLEVRRFGPAASRAGNGRDMVPVLLIGASDAADSTFVPCSGTRMLATGQSACSRGVRRQRAISCGACRFWVALKTSTRSSAISRLAASSPGT